MKRTVKQWSSLKAGIGWQKKHRANPQLWVTRLWEACEESGLEILKKFWLVVLIDADKSEPDRTPIWGTMTALVLLPDGNPGIVDLYPKTTSVNDPKKNLHRERKQQWCKEANVPYINLKVGTKQSYMMHIHMWLIKLSMERRRNNEI